MQIGEISKLAYMTLAAMKTPQRGVLFQTQTEDKVIQLVEYAKVLYDTQPADVKEFFPLKKHPRGWNTFAAAETTAVRVCEW